MANNIKCSHTADSKITGVNLYGSRAEITRQFRLSVKEGQNNVEIEGLPWALINDSLRVEGRGPATIHDVNLAPIEADTKQPSSPLLEELLDTKTRSEKALERCKQSITALEKYLETVGAVNVKSSDLGTVVQDYENSIGQLDEKVMKLGKELEELNKKINSERENVAPKSFSDLGYRASIGVVSEKEIEVELVLIYAVNYATWRAAYDIRVDTNGNSDKPVKLIYKAIITNSTKESWENVPLVLETASPTFGLHLPSLAPWTLSLSRPNYGVRHRKSAGVRHREYAGVSFSGAQSATLDSYDPTIENYSYQPMSAPAAAPMVLATTEVASQGAVSATFRVPGLVSIPSDNGEHTFTIVELQLDAAMTWFSVPKIDTRVHLKAKIKNESEYALLAGGASVYVDGSFISKSTVPAVSPQESFECPLGIDQAVRITYPPVSKKANTTGFYTKSLTYVYIQRVTVHNTKTTPIPLVKIVDQVPVSEESNVSVKLLSPSLKLPSGSGVASGSNANNVGVSDSSATLTRSSTISAKTGHARPVSMSVADVAASSTGPVTKVSKGVVVQWDGSDEDSVDVDALGRDGKINWLCEIPAGEKVNLSLQWEVSMPPKMRTQIVGL